MYSCQIDPGSIRPKIGRPAEFWIGSLRSVPTHTAVEIEGVYPTVHASLFWPLIVGCWTVPVFAATTRPSESAIRELPATSSIASVTLRATFCGMVGSAAGVSRS